MTIYTGRVYVDRSKDNTTWREYYDHEYTILSYETLTTNIYEELIHNVDQDVPTLLDGKRSGLYRFYFEFDSYNCYLTLKPVSDKMIGCPDLYDPPEAENPASNS